MVNFLAAVKCGHFQLQLVGAVEVIEPEEEEEEKGVTADLGSDRIHSISRQYYDCLTVP